MEGFDGSGMPANATTVTNLDNMMCISGFNEVRVSKYNEATQRYETKTRAEWKEVKKKEPEFKQCCSCWKYVEQSSVFVWCEGCYNMGLGEEMVQLCVNCRRLCGQKLGAFVMRVCGQCAI